MEIISIQQTLQEISTDLKSFDFSAYNPVTDKEKLMTVLNGVNLLLARVLREFN